MCGPCPYVFAVAPDKVTITGPTEAKIGDNVTLTCETGNSNPAASIRWVVDGSEVSENYTFSVSFSYIPKPPLGSEKKKKGGSIRLRIVYDTCLSGIGKVPIIKNCIVLYSIKRKPI